MILPVMQMTARPTFPGKSIYKVVRCLEKSSRVFFKWFSDNHFPANASKCHVLLSTDQHVQVNIDASQVENSSIEKLLGVAIVVKISFEKYIEKIYAKARAKLKL